MAETLRVEYFASNGEVPFVLYQSSIGGKMFADFEDGFEIIAADF